MMAFLAELKRRNVIRMGGLYLVAAWLTVQVASTVLPMFDAPSRMPRAIVILLAIGFVPALVFAWLFELTPQGVKRESEIDRTDSITPQTGRRMDRMIPAGLALIIVLMGIERVRFAGRGAGSAPSRSTATGSGNDAAAPEKGSVGLSDAHLNWLWQPEAWSVKARQSPAFQGFAKRIGLVEYWKKYGRPDLCAPQPAEGPYAFACR